jgi:hypothetical protein
MKHGNLCDIKRPNFQTLRPFDLPDGDYPAKAIGARIRCNGQGAHDVVILALFHCHQELGWETELVYRLPSEDEHRITNSDLMDCLADVLSHLAPRLDVDTSISDILASIVSSPFLLSLHTYAAAQLLSVRSMTRRSKQTIRRRL